MKQKWVLFGYDDKPIFLQCIPPSSKGLIYLIGQSQNPCYSVLPMSNAGSCHLFIELCGVGWHVQYVKSDPHKHQNKIIILIKFQGYLESQLCLLR